MKTNHDRRRANVKKWIYDDPWTITFYQEGRTDDDADSTVTVTGRISPAGARGAPLVTVPAGPLAGENVTVKYNSVLILEWDAVQPKEGALIKAVHEASGVTIYYHLTFCRHTPDKWEIIIDERQ